MYVSSILSDKRMKEQINTRMRYMWPFRTKNKADSNDVSMLSVLRQPTIYPIDPEKTSKSFYQTKIDDSYPNTGDAFRSISFGMNESEFNTRMRCDSEIRTDRSHDWQSNYVSLFGYEFSIKAEYLDSRLYRIKMLSDSLNKYSDELRELKDSVVGMFMEKYGDSTSIDNSKIYYAGSKCWDFNGKVIEVGTPCSGKYDMMVAIIITSTAMLDEAKTSRVTKNKSQYGQYATYFLTEFYYRKLIAH